MRIQMTARHCTVSDSIRDRLEKRLEGLSRYEPRLAAAEAIFEEEKHLRKVEVILSIDREGPVVARADDREFRAAVDLVVDRLAKQLRRQRSQRVDHQGPSRSVGPVETDAGAEPAASE